MAAGFRNQRRGRSRAFRIPGAAFALLTLLLPAVVGSCEPRAEPTATASDSASARDPGLTLSEDTGSFATPLELASLSAELEIPVAGVTPLQLRDTYGESRGDHVHHALDILAPRGTPVLSATDGRLLKLFDSKAGGLMVYATDASERFILLYGHLDGYAEGLSEGMRLVRGQLIGYVGTTGNAPPGTPHLHFGILRGHPRVSWSRGVAVNPYPLLVSPPRADHPARRHRRVYFSGPLGTCHAAVLASSL